MEPIRRQVRRARRRLLFQQFLGVFGWSMFIALLVTAAGLAIPKRWVLEVDPVAWRWSCIAGGIISGLAMAILATLCAQRGALDAAIELDRRFALKERVSSTLALSPDEAQTDIGQALIADASRRVAELDVAERFPVRPPWTIGLPFIPALLVFALVLFVPDAASQKKARADAADARSVIRKESEKLKQQLKKKRAQLNDENLKEAEELLRQLEKALDDLQKQDDIDRKKAMIKINEMARMVEQKREKLEGSEAVRKQLAKLENIQQGPGEKIAEAMQQGNFEQAKNELEKLKERLARGDLSDQEKAELAEQLTQMQEQMKRAKEAFEEAKRQLEEQMAQKAREGDLQAANELQKKLDKLNQMNSQMDKLGEMADALEQSAESLRQGNAQEAAAHLDRLAQDLQQMQNELDELETLGEMLTQLAATKDAMCENPGDGQSHSMAQSSAISRQSGRGMGAGQGFGERPEEENSTQNYESRVAAEVRKGPSVVSGVASGPNIAGQSRESVKEAILRSMSEKSDPLTDQPLPRDQRDHAKEYFQRFQPER